MSQIERMTVALPVEMADFIKHAVESGDYASSSEVFRDAIRDWKHKRQLQQQHIEYTKRVIAQGLTDISAGKFKSAKEIFSRLERKYQDM